MRTWARGCWRNAWTGEALLPAQAWMLEHMFHLSPAGTDERPPAPRAQADKWTLNIRAARQFHTREGHLQPSRKTVEAVDGDEHEKGCSWTTPAVVPTSPATNDAPNSTRWGCAGRA